MNINSSLKTFYKQETRHTRSGFVMLSALLIVLLAVSLAMAVLSYAGITQKNVANYHLRTQQYHDTKAEYSEQLWTAKKLKEKKDKKEKG